MVSDESFAIRYFKESDQHQGLRPEFEDQAQKGPNNLILGDMMHNSIKELLDHRIPYPVANLNNRHLYMSVSAVQ